MTVAVLAGLALFFWGIENYNARNEATYFQKKLVKRFGEMSDKEYSLERFAKIGSYYRKHREPGQIDDITWNDLDMDEIFMRMDYSLSATGEEYLYYRLRTPIYEEDKMQQMEKNICYFTEHDEERIKVQMLMRKLGFTGKYSLYDYLDNLDNLGKRSNVKHYILDLMYIPATILMAVNFSLGFFVFILVMVWGIVTYFKEKGEINPYIVSLGFVMRLYALSRELDKLQLHGFEQQMQMLEKGRNSLKKMYRGSFWVMSGQNSNATGGNPAEMILDYVRMIFHPDLIKFNRMLHVLRDKYAELDDMITAAGYLESMISIASYRASLKNGYCVPEFAKNAAPCLEIEHGYHPMLNEPVKNSIITGDSILLTGSNASGKSTFLKTVALSAIMAQTVHTVTADAYRAPMFAVFSAMSLRDSLMSGESYYIVEIKAIKRIMDEIRAKRNDVPVLCFVDEVLRGTNTIERIAAAAQILKKISEDGALCFAATHDIELTELLKEHYVSYHFAEAIREGDIVFDYQLREGKAGTRNAIGLLKILGYPPEITDGATECAKYFEQSGNWKL